jgi:hypothetical protein
MTSHWLEATITTDAKVQAHQKEREDEDRKDHPEDRHIAGLRSSVTVSLYACEPRVKIRAEGISIELHDGDDPSLCEVTGPCQSGPVANYIQRRPDAGVFRGEAHNGGQQVRPH